MLISKNDSGYEMNEQSEPTDQDPSLFINVSCSNNVPNGLDYLRDEVNSAYYHN